MWSNILHNVGNVLAPALKTAASATDFLAPEGSTVDRAAQSFYNIGASINDPNQTYGGGGFDGSASWLQRPVTAVQGATTGAPTNNTGGGNYSIRFDLIDVNALTGQTSLP